MSFQESVAFVSICTCLFKHTHLCVSIFSKPGKDLKDAYSPLFLFYRLETQGQVRDFWFKVNQLL